MKIGERFGRLIVLGRSEKKKHWLCRCDCGAEKAVLPYSLMVGRTKSCGCFRKEATRMNSAVHLRSHTRGAYNTWRGMRERCTNPNHISYKNYGARGIAVSEEWRTDFNAFLRDMGDPPGPGYSLDRIDSNLDYCKENCRWATRTQQNRNAKKNRIVTVKGESKTVPEWSEITGIGTSILYDRLNKLGWTDEQAVLTPRLLNGTKHRIIHSQRSQINVANFGER